MMISCLFPSFSPRAFRGKHLSFIVRFPNQGRQVDDLEVWSHTNDTIGSVRRCILNRIKANVAHTKIELFVGGELIDPGDDRKLIGQLNLKDKSVSIYSCQVSAKSNLRLYLRNARSNFMAPSSAAALHVYMECLF